MTFAACILAAGASSRMGSPKALLELPGGQTFLSRVLEVARKAGAAPRIVVLGHHAEAIEPHVPREADLTIVKNPQPERGQLSSLKVGLAAATSAGAEGLLCWPVDHPLVGIETVAQLLHAAQAHPGLAIVPRSGGRGGHPTYFPRALFEALRELPDNEGARALIRQPGRTFFLETTDRAVRRDFDTPEDYAQIFTIE